MTNLAYEIEEFVDIFAYELEEFWAIFAYELEIFPIFASEFKKVTKMIKRNLLNDLQKWAKRPNRKPLVIRGARQVGKTTLVKEFSKEFDAFIMLNLERPTDSQLFQKADTPKQIMEIIRLTRLTGLDSMEGKRVLLFIDEIQSEPKAIGMLRYFYEDFPQLYIIAAGSRLQELFRTGVSFPVGRVEYLSMRPCVFDEFLDALGLDAMRQQLIEGLPDPILHDELARLFQTYALVGGMPEIVALYAQNREVASLAPLYSGLLQSYDEDVEKYAANANQIAVLRHLLRNGWSFAGQSITFARFAGSSYSSTTVHKAFELLEKAFLISLDYPTSSVKAPVIPALSKSPKLVWLDCGLVNFSAAIQVEYLTNTSLADVWRGHAAEQVVGQELLPVLDRNYIEKESYWIRDKKGSNAEVDFILPLQGRVIPIEVKSGSNAHLRSLQSFMAVDGAADLAVRVWPSPYSIDEVKCAATGRTFRLVNLPFYLVGQLDKILTALT